MNYVINPKGKELAKRAVCAFIDRLPDGKPYLVDITKLVKKRSNPQNSALWGVAYKVICKETGYKDQALHELLCGEFFGWQVSDMFGNKKRVPVRTTTHDENGKRDVICREKLSEYYQFIQGFAAEYSVYVPDPDPEWFLK